MSGIRANRESLSTHSKASLVLLPFLGVAITTHASAQVVSAGDGSNTVIEANGNQFNITGGQLSSNEANLFHNFEQFGLSSGQIANFETVPDVQNVIGNVSGGQASTINGTLQVSGSDANLYLMNPAGILMGPDAQLNLSGGFTATTATGIGFEDGQFDAQTSDYEQLIGTPTSFRFDNEQAGAVVNTGDLSVDEGNSISLIGGTVVNAGRLSAPEGTVTITAVEGESRVRISQGDQLLSLEVEAVEPSQTVPQITAQSIGSMLTGSGLSEATALIAEPDGTVRLGSAVVDESGGRAIAAGSLSTFGKTGGDVNVLGNRVELMEANVDASGIDGGGLVRIGGDYRGKGSVANATETLFDKASVVAANALENGDGGRVIVWAGDTAKFYGSISATGGVSAGNGGFVEISGKNLLSATGEVDLSALRGNFGTVLLDPENLVITDEFPIPPDDDSTSYLSSAYVEALSNGANVELEATNDFTIRALSDGELFFDAERSVTFKADSDGMGGGAFSMGEGDTIRAERGDVFISGAGITTGIIDTSTDKEDEHGSATNVDGGTVELRSSLEITSTEILTYGERDGNHSGNGGNVFLEALGGDVVVNRAIKTYSQAGEHESGFGGYIRLESSDNIRVGTDFSTEDVLDASSRAEDHTSRIGGDIWLNAGADITVLGGISTRSVAKEEQRTGSLYEQGGGQIKLRAVGSISTQNIISASDAGISSETNISNAGNGGSILLEAGTDISTGSIDTISLATGGANSGLAGDVSLKAGREIKTQDISTDSVAVSGAGQAGDISLSAQAVSVEGRISGLSEDSTVRRSDSAAIQLLGNIVTFGDGPNSVAGSTIEIAPLDASRNVDVGSSTDSEFELRITDSELAAIGNNVERISIGRADSAGSVRLATSVTSAETSDRAPINILGARALLGSDENTVYNIRNIRSGSIVGSGSAVTTFSDVHGIRGGSGDDNFVITPGVPASSFEELKGGDGDNVLDYTNFTVGIDVPLSGLSSLKVLASEDAGQMNRLVGANTNSAWRISRAGSGTVDTTSEQVEFEGFSYLVGGADNDFFEILENGFVKRISGSDGFDTISFGNNRNATSIDLQSKTARNALSSFEFSEVESFIGSGSNGSAISGIDSGSRWEVSGENSGSVDNLTFANFYELLGKDGDDTFLFYDGGLIAGGIEGGGGNDVLDYSNYGGTVELSLASSSIYSSLNQFLLIENVVGNGTASILGGDRGTTWEISGNDSGFVEGLSFSGFNRLVGGIEDDGFSFVGDGKITGYVVGGSGTGTDILDYENHTSAVEIYPDRVLGEEESLITNQFLEIEKVLGDKNTSILHSYDMRNRFEVQQDGSVKLGDLVAVNIAGVSGSGENAVLDYSGIDRAIAVDLENSRIFDGLNLEFENISRIVGDEGYENALIGTDGDDQFEIVGDREIRTGELSVSQFSSVDGGEGINQFIVNEELASNVSIQGGGDTLTSQNLISSEVADANWWLNGKNTGGIEGPTGITLAEFSQVQKLENNTTGGTHRVAFTRYDSQITGGINSGNSNLVLIGNDINIGHSDGSNNLVGGEISGTGTLTILSESAGVDIELGGGDSRSAASNITSGEIAAIQDSFSNVIIGDRNLTNRVLLKDDVSFGSAVALRSSDEVNAEGYRLAADGVLIESDRITAGAIDSRDSVSLVARTDIAVEAISAGGQGIEISSETGSVSVEGGISTSSGGVTIDAQDNITVGFVDAASENTDSPGFIKIETAEDFTATEFIPGTDTSLSTAGVESGSIDILYGNQDRPEKPFLVGQESRNGTVGGIRAVLKIVSGDVPSGTSQGGITIIDRGFQLAEPRVPVVPLKIVEPLTEQSSAPEIAIVGGGSSSSKEILRSLETGMNEGFETYLNLPGKSTKRLVTTLEDMQKTLREVEETTETTSALVYVYFVPDAASEAAVLSQSDEIAAPDDQLEVMLINAVGEPVRKRQWGVTRAQVEAASLDLRQQTTSQFTSASQYLKPAQQLYDWIMRPIAATLREEEVESVGFVMDTGLRTMPIAALHDGDRYLVENYSLGLLPTFSLTEFQTSDSEKINLEEARVLAMGASRFEEQPDLPAVDAEIALITEELWEGDAFLNEDFVLENLQTQIKGQDYGVVHLATHASFESDNLEQSYIQLWDEKLALDDISELGLDQSSVSLIILSACNTALGDQASEYGFAGFAVTSGSRTALASLWPVNDEGTLGFMSQFYSELRQAPVRADALRQAQISLLRGEVGIDSGVVYDAIGDEVAVLPSLAESGRWDFSHPFFWSAFTMIGNPW